MKIAAIPTKYAGIQFRSRLEARWAAFFDLLKWTWEYEPIDLDVDPRLGRGYIPDFIVSNTWMGRVFVEVKPARIGDDISDVIAKAFDAGCDRIAVVGLDFRDYPEEFTDGGDVSIGSIAGKSGEWTAPFDLWWDEHDAKWTPTIGGKDSGSCTNTKAARRAHRLWRSAQNRVQWKGVKATPKKPREPRARRLHPFNPPMGSNPSGLERDPLQRESDGEMISAAEAFAELARLIP